MGQRIGSNVVVGVALAVVAALGTTQPGASAESAPGAAGNPCPVIPITGGSASMLPQDNCDMDNDGAGDTWDNCIDIYNPGQEDSDGDGAGGLGHDLGIEHEAAHGVEDLLFSHGGEGVHVPGGHLPGEDPGFEGPEAVGHGIHGPEPHPAPGLPRCEEAGRALRLHPDHPHVGPEALHGQGDPADEAATPARNVDRLHLRAVLEDLKTDRPLTGDHVRIVEGWDVVEPSFLGQLSCPPDAVLGGVAVPDHLGPPPLDGLELDGDHVFRDHHHTGHSQLPRDVGHGLAMVPGGGGHDPPPARLRVLQHVVECTARLEGPRDLERLQLQEERRIRTPHADEGSAQDPRLEALGRLQDVPGGREHPHPRSGGR